MKISSVFLKHGHIAMAARLMVVGLVVTMMVLSAVQRHATHTQSLHATADHTDDVPVIDVTDVNVGDAVARHTHRPTASDNMTVDREALLTAWHGHGGERADHDHATPLAVDRASGPAPGLQHFTGVSFAARLAGRDPRAPKPPPRV